MPLQLFDTHTHFDLPEFDADRSALAQSAVQQGVQGLVLIGYLAQYFDRLAAVQQQLQQQKLAQQNVPDTYLAAGLHPFYILEHQPDDLLCLERFLQTHACVAVGEIGLDTYTDQMKQPSVYQTQKDLFSAQLDLAQQFELPVMLHIRRAHADSLAMLKRHRFRHGGIAHAFSGGIQEAKAFIQLGFKIGITGQITDPNAKKLRNTIQQLVYERGLGDLVLETDCPDMTPLCCQTSTEHRTRNTPVNLPYVLESLAQTLDQSERSLAAQLWQNSLAALYLKF